MESKHFSPKFGDGSPLPEPDKYLHQGYLNSTCDKPILLGIDNLGTNCFMNSVLQCLQCLPIWSNYLWLEHCKECQKKNNECFGCVLSALSYIHYKQPNIESFNPSYLCQILGFISKDFKPFEQQDAHEFLICFFERMQENLAPKNVSPYMEMTTAVAKIFGGFLRSQIACQECLTTSNTYEPYFNISLDIENIDSMETALNNFFEIDTFDNTPCYNCEKCQKQTRAAKRYTIETLPEVLIIQLKRYDMSGRKLLHKVDFPKILDLKSCTSSIENCKKYRLYGIITHLGISLRGGHYISFISHPSTNQYNWHCIDDETMWNVTWLEVASQKAYLLFYIKCDPHMTDEDFEDISKSFSLDD